STRIAPVDSGSRGPSPSRAPSEPRPSPCKDNERSINRDLPLLINASHVDSFQEEEDGSLCSTPDTSILDSLPRQSDVEEQDFAPQGSPNATTDGYSCHEIKGPAIVVNHPVSKKHPHRDEPLVIMETTATSFKSSRFDYSDCFNNATAQTSQEASGADAHFQESKEITPQLFDDILPHMHSPFVARYAHFDGSFSKAVEPHARLVAALPSRIVAQIASDSFMDYELVSDFFLTFRSYLDPQRLLQLLFARLEWSLDRKTADGRIVRIRTFAALRHWVLNYFVDDFMHETD
ncbi:Guanine nucleotide exchange factor lte1, partial [Ascosphaera aggregata]